VEPLKRRGTSGDLKIKNESTHIEKRGQRARRKKEIKKTKERSERAASRRRGLTTRRVGLSQKGEQYIEGKRVKKMSTAAGGPDLRRRRKKGGRGKGGENKKKKVFAMRRELKRKGKTSW